jgi:hypothetical protein
MDVLVLVTITKVDPRLTVDVKALETMTELLHVNV